MARQWCLVRVLAVTSAFSLPCPGMRTLRHIRHAAISCHGGCGKPGFLLGSRNCCSAVYHESYSLHRICLIWGSISAPWLLAAAGTVGNMNFATQWTDSCFERREPYSRQYNESAHGCHPSRSPSGGRGQAEWKASGNTCSTQRFAAIYRSGDC